MSRPFVTTLSALLATIVLGTPQLPAADSYAVDPSHTSVVFSVAHMQPAISYTYGFFRKIEGSFVIDKGNPAACRFQFSIPVDSLFTNDEGRDKHLKGPDFFNAQQFPNITFQSTSCAAAPAEPGKVSYNVTGNLSLLGQTRQVTVLVQWVGEGQGPFGNYRAGFLSQFGIKRSDFGMSGMLNMVGDNVGITVSCEGIRQAAAGAAPQ